MGLQFAIVERDNDAAIALARLREARRIEAAERTRAHRRRMLAAVAFVVAAGVIAAWLGSRSTPRPVHGARPVRHLVAATKRRRPVPVARKQTGPSPGSLPQTSAFPSGRSPLFKSLMASLWAGVDANAPALALPAFFPEGAYVQLKAIYGASSDWKDRLVHDFRLDIAAAHALLGRGAANATLIGVRVVRSYGHWVPPGVCYNRDGYYEMPNARVVYRVDGRVRSFGIASLISWRGVWYVVHFGAILRATDTGMVDDPASGPGVSAYSGTC